MTVTQYLQGADTSAFSCEKKTITGSTEDPICIHVTMYPMDFISSSLHTLFPEYLEKDSPILTMSLEHLFAMMLDTEQNGKDIIAYWKKRKADIKKYPSIRLDNNELDLYYEMINEENGSMLNQIKQNGLLDNMNPHGRIISSFHNQFGQEIRPAKDMLMALDSTLLEGVFKYGKTRYGINKRYLASLEDCLLI